jgi:hypothetical protein
MAEKTGGPENGFGAENFGTGGAAGSAAVASPRLGGPVFLAFC